MPPSVQPVLFQWHILIHCLSLIYTAENCSKNVNETINLLFELGFTINYEKSVSIPAHSIKFLGFIIDSNTMTIRPTSEKLKIERYGPVIIK